MSVHAGHTISVAGEFIPGRYRVRARIADVFEKNGRSGPLRVVVHAAELSAETGPVVIAMREQQIVRWHRSREPQAPARRAHRDHGDGAGIAKSDPDIGATVAAVRRRAPDAPLVRAYASSLGSSEPLFVDSAAARAIGFADVIVPGPLQSTLFEALLLEQLPAWHLVSLSLSFRVSVIVDEPIALRAVVTDLSPRPHRLVVDLTLENSHGESAAVGTATLFGPPSRGAVAAR